MQSSYNINNKTKSHTPPIELTSVWECENPQQADAILGHQMSGYVYRREGHPNGETLAESCRELHGTEIGKATSSGMGAIVAAVLAAVQSGEHIILSDRLYGRTTFFITKELTRLGIEHSLVDMRSLDQVSQSLRANTRLLIVETIANPRLEIFDIAALAKLAHANSAYLLVDNTFASPYVCQPAQLGADFVMESLTKGMNGHSDVLLGWIGSQQIWEERLNAVIATWGLVSHPLDTWLAQRSLTTFSLRMEKMCQNALAVAQFLKTHAAVTHVDYPGLEEFPQYTLARQQFGERFGCMVTFHLRSQTAFENFLKATPEIPFCPSLGTSFTSVSHPASTSHRSYSIAAQEALGIRAGTVRMSVGVESLDLLLKRLTTGLAACATI
jgi:cystathionine beta-lyase/cystathionine gamma-synthase